MRVELRLTEVCNYDCSYCKDLHNNRKGHQKFDFYGFDDFLNKVPDPYVFIYGGEPTTHPEFIDVVRFLIYRGITAEVQTNGSNRGVIRQLPPEVKINYSYHSEKIGLHEFIGNITGTNINEIAFMSDGDDQEYVKLKKMFGKKVQYCPILNSRLDDHSNRPELISIINKDIFGMIKKDYHFRTHENGVSNFGCWCDQLNSLDRLCKVQQTTIHVQYNKVYFCFNAMMKDVAGISFEAFEYSDDVIRCPFEYCYFGMENWE